MRTIVGRVWAFQLAVFLVAVVASGGLLYALGQIRAEVRLEQAEHAQIESYLSLSAQLRGLYAEYLRVLDHAERGPVDFRALRSGIDSVLFSLRGEIERESLAVEALAGQWEGEPERDQLVTLASEIEAILSAVEAADALFNDDRDAEAAALLTETLNDGLVLHLDPLIEAAVQNDRAEAEKTAEEIQAMVARLETLTVVFVVAILALVVAGALLVGLALGRAIPSLRAQMDSVALGGEPDGSVPATPREFAGLHRSLDRISAAQQGLLTRNRDLQKAIEQRTETMRGEHQDLRTQDQVRRDFLADISHELRTPLTVLRGVAEVALRTKRSDPDQLRTAMARIVDEANHVGRIVNDLFFIARSQAGALDLRTDIVDLRDVAVGAREEAQSLASQGGGRLDWHGPDDAVEVEGDGGRLRQLLLILVDNALKHGGRPPKVRVRCEVEEQAVQIQVLDNGAGLSEDDLPHVFERLYRGRAAPDSEPGGSGLGLAVAKSIVDGHGGSISIANASGGGAIATVRLPRFHADEEVLEAIAQ